MIPPEVVSGISDAIGSKFAANRVTPVSGGSICRAWLLDDGSSRFFVKQGSLPFDSEIASLREIAATKTLRVPQPLASGGSGNSHWLALEYVELRRFGDWALLGEQLAAMHRVTAAQFGYERDNYLGITPQSNSRSSDWACFWRDARLAPQFELAAGMFPELAEQGSRLIDGIGAFFTGAQPAASLLHGDLWSGNAGFDENGTPVIYDPASYYGDREADLAMTELFGGFDADFYSAYRESYPLDSGYRVRKTLYNLYHVLNHLNLFGGGYLAQAESMVGTLLAEI